MKVYMQLVGYRSDGVSSDCISKIGETESLEAMTVEEVIAERERLLSSAKAKGYWRPFVLVALQGRRWAPDSRPGWYMGGRWLYSFMYNHPPKADVHALASAMAEKEVLK